MTLMVARPGENIRYVYEKRILAVPAAVGVARDLVAGRLRKWEMEERADDARLVVSELVTNAADRHVAYGREIGVRLVLFTTGALRIEVTDPGPGEPRLRTADSDDEGGRGLFIVRHLATEVGTALAPGGGKTVWATLAG